MNIISSIVSSLAGEVAKYAINPTKRQFSYVFDHKDMMQKLKDQVDTLINARERVQHSVDAATRRAEAIEQDVQKWLESVNQKITGGEQILKEEESMAKNKCFFGLCPNFKSRYQMSKKGEEVLEAVAELLKEYNQGAGRFDKVSYVVAPHGIGDTTVKGYEDFSSRSIILDRIMAALKDPYVQAIGVYGMGGVGKTMLVKEAARKAKQDSIFDEVAMASVSREVDIRKIQGEIADALGLKFEEETDIGRAMKLRQRLNNNKERFLIILDDVWKRIDLEAIGISFEDEQSTSATDAEKKGNFQKSPTTRKSKILLTSRSQEVLGYHVDAKENSIEVKTLSEVEAMGLFSKLVGRTLEEPPYKSIAEELVKKCAGLPVAISAIANALKDKSQDIWKDTIRQLRMSNPRNIEEVDERVYAAIRLSYDYLRNEDAQLQFLLCGLHPQGSDILVSHLVRYNFGLDLLKGINTLEESRACLTALVHKLKASSLLLGGNNDSAVKMHDIVRDVSISIASEDKKFFVVNDEARLSELVRRQELINSVAVSLPHSNIQQLPQVLNCPELNLLLLFSQKDNSILKVPDDFFREMKKLKVLNLMGMNLPSLPPSFCSLTNLKTLHLHNCLLGDVSIVMELKELQIISFQGSNLKELPREIAQLTQLRLLDLNNCSELKVIPSNIISKLSLLEELYVDSFSKWEVEGNASIAELKNLPNLTSLDIVIGDSKLIQATLSSKKLDRFRVVIGDQDYFWSSVIVKYDSSRVLKLGMDKSIRLDHIKILLEKAEEIYLKTLEGFKNILYEFNGTGFRELKKLHIERCSEIQYIINSVESNSRKAFPCLESISLSELHDLEKICHGRLQAESLKRLRFIYVRGCNKLQNLFSFSMTRKLPQLQEITVESCQKLREIVAEEDMNDDTDPKEATNQIDFPQLLSLCLHDCVQFTSFCFAEKCQAQLLAGETSSSPVPVFNSKVLLPNLENLELYCINNERIWSSQLSCIHLTRLSVKSCENLKHLFSPSVARSLKELKGLKVSTCRSMKEIIAAEGIEEGKSKMEDMIVFPQLNYLELHNCDVLTQFYSSRSEVTEDLKDSCVSSIEALFDEKVAFPKLESMQIKDLNLKMMFVDGHVCANSFPELKAIQVESCAELLTLFPSNMLGVEGLIGTAKKNSIATSLSIMDISGCAKLLSVFPSNMLILGGLSRLEYLSVRDCSSLEQIFEVGGLDSDHTRKTNAIATSLSLMDISGCANLLSVFPSNMLILGGLSRLENLRVRDCSSLGQIFEVEGLDSDHTRKTNTIATSLSNMIISGCAKLLSVFPSNMLILGGLSRLENFNVSDCSSLEQIFEVEGLDSDHTRKTNAIATSLSLMDISGCAKLLSVFPSNMLILGGLSRLEHFSVRDCSSLEQIFEVEGLDSDHTRKTNAIATSLSNMDISGCAKLLSVFPSNMLILGGLSRLENFSVRDCSSLEQIFEVEGFDSDYIRKTNAIATSLSNMVISGCAKLLSVFPSNMLILGGLSRLEYLSVRDCSSLEQIFEVGGLDSDHTRKTNAIATSLSLMDISGCANLLSVFPSNMLILGGLSRLENLRVRDCSSLGQIFEVEGLDSDHTRKTNTIATSLSNMIISGCAKLLSVFPSNMLILGGLSRLEHFSVRDCSSLEQIFEVEGLDSDHTRKKNAVATSLSNMVISGCAKLLSVFPSNMLILGGLSRLENFSVRDCSSLEQIFEVEGFDSDYIRKTNAIATSLSNMVISGCAKLLSVFPSNMLILGGLSRLENFSVSDCSSLEQIFEVEGLDSDHTRKTNAIATSLSNMIISGCAKLLSVFPSNMLILGGLSRLEHFSVRDCSSLERIFEVEGLDSTRETNAIATSLSNMVISGCAKLLSVFPSNMLILGGLSRLENFSVSDCSSLEQIFEVEGLDSDHTRKTNAIATSLSNMIISGCAKLLSVFPSNMLILGGLSRLEHFSVRDCSSLERIFEVEGLDSTRETNAIATSLSNMVISGCAKLLSVFPSNMLILGGLSRLENFSVRDCSSLEQIFEVEGLDSDHTRKTNAIATSLSDMHISDCAKLLTVFPSNMLILGGLSRLETLYIQNCDSLEQIFEVEGLDSDCGKTNVISTQLKELNIESLRNLKHIWSKDAERFFTFKNLHSVIAKSCMSLKSILTASVARDEGLPLLKELILEYCGLEEIVSNEGVKEIFGPVQFRFPQVSSVRLWDLPNLKCFYPEIHTTDWPSLKSLVSYHCGQIKVLGTQPFSIQEGLGAMQPDSPIQPPLFCVQKVSHSLEELSLNSEECKMFDDKRLRDVHFPNVKLLQILCFHDKSGVFPWGLLQNFKKLESLEVFCCEFECLWTCEGNANEEDIDVDAKSGTWTFPSLRELTLRELPNLKMFSGPKQVLQQLEALQVLSCDGLVKSLAPSSAAFPCLKTLLVYNCNSIEFLFTSSTAKSLLQLRELVVQFCENLRHMFVAEFETEHIVLTLEHLELTRLPKLTRLIYPGELEIKIHFVHAPSK